MKSRKRPDHIGHIFCSFSTIMDEAAKGRPLDLSTSRLRPGTTAQETRVPVQLDLLWNAILASGYTVFSHDEFNTYAPRVSKFFDNSVPSGPGFTPRRGGTPTAHSTAASRLPTPTFDFQDFDALFPPTREILSRAAKTPLQQWFTDPADTRRVQNFPTQRKAVGSVGPCCRARIEWNTENNPYTGLFKPGSADHCLVRASVGLKPPHGAFLKIPEPDESGLREEGDAGASARPSVSSSVAGGPRRPRSWFSSWLQPQPMLGLIPCVALKIFPAAPNQRAGCPPSAESANIIFMGKKTGQFEADYFRYGISNHVTEKVGFWLKPLILGARNFTAYPCMMGLSHVAGVGREGVEDEEEDASGENPTGANVPATQGQGQQGTTTRTSRTATSAGSAFRLSKTFFGVSPSVPEKHKKPESSRAAVTLPPPQFQFLGDRATSSASEGERPARPPPEGSRTPSWASILNDEHQYPLRLRMRRLLSPLPSKEEPCLGTKPSSSEEDSSSSSKGRAGVDEPSSASRFPFRLLLRPNEELQLSSSTTSSGPLAGPGAASAAHFDSTSSSASQPSLPPLDRLWLLQLLTIPAGTKLYDIFAVGGPDDMLHGAPPPLATRIGCLRSTSEFVLSHFGDTVLYFRHQAIEEDLALRPGWAEVLTQNPALKNVKTEDLLRQVDLERMGAGGGRGAAGDVGEGDGGRSRSTMVGENKKEAGEDMMDNDAGVSEQDVPVDVAPAPQESISSGVGGAHTGVGSSNGVVALAAGTQHQKQAQANDKKRVSMRSQLCGFVPCCQGSRTPGEQTKQ